MKLLKATVTAAIVTVSALGLNGCAAMIGVENFSSYDLCTGLGMSELELMAYGTSKNEIAEELNSRGINPMSAECTGVATSTAAIRQQGAADAMNSASQARRDAEASARSHRPTRTQCRTGYGNTVNCTTY